MTIQLSPPMVPGAPCSVTNGTAVAIEVELWLRSAPPPARVARLRRWMADRKNPPVLLLKFVVGPFSSMDSTGFTLASGQKHTLRALVRGKRNSRRVVRKIEWVANE